MRPLISVSIANASGDRGCRATCDRAATANKLAELGVTRGDADFAASTRQRERPRSDRSPRSDVAPIVSALRIAAAGIGLMTASAFVIAASTTKTMIATAHSAAQAPECNFDFPVGPPDGTGYYDAQPFGANDHLGNDWNGVGGGDTDLGEPVYAVADGVVLDASDHGAGWGNVIRILHTCGDQVESIYAHLDDVDAEIGTIV